MKKITMDKEYFDGNYKKFKELNKNLTILLTGNAEFYTKLGTIFKKIKLGDEWEWEGVELMKNCVIFLDYNYPKEAIEIF